MLLAGLFCVLGAIGLLVVGLIRGDPDLVWASIGASAAGGLAVLAASIQRGRALRRSAAANGKSKRSTVTPSRPPVSPASARRSQAATAESEAEAGPLEEDVAAVETAPQASPAETAAGAEAVPDSPARDAPPAQEDVDAAEHADPVDEPAEEDVDAADLLLVIDLTDEVLVVDLRPRYHLATCTHLDDRGAIPLPVNEAREDGFTPCGLCRPDAALAAAVRQAESPGTGSGADRSKPRPGPG